MIVIIIIVWKDDMRGECGKYGENCVWDYGGETLKANKLLVNRRRTWKNYVKRVLKII
jgi:hypothetical protein